MSASPLADRLQAAGAIPVRRDGAVATGSYGDVAAEVAAVRGAAGLMVADHVAVFRGPVDDALFPLDEVLAGNVANLRFGRVLHTLLADPAGRVVADAYVACDEDDLLVLAETCVPRSDLAALLARCPVRDVTDEVAVLCVDGPRAWSPLRDLVGRDVLGMPYLSVEDHAIDGVPTAVLRAGKTAEFGYWLVAPADGAGRVHDRVADAGRKAGILPYGLDALDRLKLDGRFFNVNREGREVGDPLELGLQWMIDFGKERFSGRDAILDRRSAGVPRKVVGIAMADGAAGLSVGDRVRLDGDDAGRIVACGPSSVLGREMGLALLDRAAAWAGLDLVVRSPSGDRPATSISMPPFVPESLRVRLDEV